MAATRATETGTRQMEYAVVWRGTTGGIASGGLAVEESGLVLRGRGPSGSIARERLPFDQIVATRIGRTEAERIHGARSVVLDLRRGKVLAIAPLVTAGGVLELADLIARRLAAARRLLPAATHSVQALPPAAHEELLGELRLLCARLPLPQPDWHPHAALIRACHDDFEQTLAVATVESEVLDLVAAIVEGEEGLAFEATASPALTAAHERLLQLPRPAGQHPFLDEILPALEAMQALLIALSHVPRAAEQLHATPVSGDPRNDTTRAGVLR